MWTKRRISVILILVGLVAATGIVLFALRNPTPSHDTADKETDLTVQGEDDGAESRGGRPGVESSEDASPADADLPERNEADIIDLAEILNETLSSSRAEPAPHEPPEQSVESASGIIEGIATLDGEALSNVSVSIDQRDGARFHTNASTSGVGTYTATELPAGEYLVTARTTTPDGRQLKAERMAIVADDAVTIIDFPFEFGSAAVEGTITVQGRAPSSAYVSGWIQAESGEHEFRANLEESGYFHASALPTGETRVRVRITEGDGLRQTQDKIVELLAGETTTVNFDFGGGGKISGHLINFIPGGNDGVLLYPGHRTMPRPDELDPDTLEEINASLYKDLYADNTGYFADAHIEAGEYTLVGYSAEGDQPADFRAARYGVLHITVTEGSEQVFEVPLITY